MITFQQQQGIKRISEKNSSIYNQIRDETINSELFKMLGAPMITAIKANLTSERFVNILSPKTFTNCYDNEVTHEGLRYVLAYLIYSRYIGQSSVKDTYSGMVKQNRNETEHVSFGHIQSLQQDAKNIAVSQFEIIKSYIEENKDDYPEFENGRNRVNFKPRMKNIRKTYR